MKENRRKSIATWLLSAGALVWSYSTVAQSVTQVHKDSLVKVVRNYYDHSLAIYQDESQLKDIEMLFDLFTEDFVYVHEKYGGSYSRKDLYEGYVRNQEEGRYGSVADVRVENMVVGLNAVATERVFLKEENGTLVEVDPGMTLFEFKDGKISRITEYW